MISKDQHFGALDLYRFVAAFGVAALHYSQFVKYSTEEGFGYFVGAFALFVDFFFILSGFVIGLTYADSVNAASGIFTFLRRRIARIYPLYLLTLLVFLAPTIFGASRHPEKWTATSIVQDMLLVKSWPLHSQLPFNFPAWSISVEWAMYLAFPLMMLFYRRLGMPLLIGLIVTGFAGIEYILITGAIEPALWVANTSPIRALPTFAIGILISQTFRSATIPRALGIGVALFCVAVFALVNHANVYLILLLFSGAVFCTANGHLNQKTIFDSAPVRALGDASYSIYMLHAIFLTVFVEMVWPKFSNSQPTIWYGVAIAIMLLGASILTFRFFEKPAKDFVNGRSNRVVGFVRTGG